MTILTFDHLIDAMREVPVRPDLIKALAFTIMALQTDIQEAIAALAPSSDTLADLISIDVLRRQSPTGPLTINPDLLESWKIAQAEAEARIALSLAS
jgi:hypothetical protein